MKDIIQLSAQEYLAYIMLYTANADFNIVKEEIQTIRNILDKDELYRIRTDFEEKNDFERLAVIMHYKDIYLKTLIDTATLQARMNEVLMSDDRFPSVEKAVLMMLNKLLSLAT